MAAGCNNNTNKKVQIECDKDEPKCQTNKSKNFELEKTVRS